MKKLITLLLALTLVTSLFVGCGKDKAEETGTDAGTDTGTETGTDAGTDADAVTAASITDNADVLVKALGTDGFWIVCATTDLTYDNEIVVDGQFHNKGDETQDIYRKLALYTQDDDHNIIDQFTLTAPKMTVKSENFKIQGGTFAGDVYVEANGFTLGKAATIDGNVYFANQEYMDSFDIDDTATVNGSTEVAEAADAVTAASITDNADVLVKALSADGFWIVCATTDLTYDNEIVVDGQFHNKGDEAQDIYRKLALYTQDDDHNIIDQFTLTAPKMTVNSENFKIQGGTFAGDVYVEANGFTLGKAATIDGNVYFANQEYMDSFDVDDTATVNGVTEVQ